MSARTTVLALALLLPALPAAAQQEDTYRHGYLRTVEPGVTLQRASEAAAETAVPNLPFLPGDRVWTDDSGRMEVRFADGSVLRLDSRSKLDYVAHEGGRRDERIVLRLWSGAVFLHYRDGRRSPDIAIETPEGVLEPADRGVYRLDVQPGQVRALAFAGEATVEAGRRVRVAEGEQVIVREGEIESGPERMDSYEADDAFARWDADLERQLAYADAREEWLPEEVSPYAADFATYGTWHSEPEYGYVW
ncbi:MAG TPA: FecR family protein, partial [Vicinamibacteria bacterium]|nr:FecR family protein [Vicinamibacteria bacterium]